MAFFSFWWSFFCCLWSSFSLFHSHCLNSGVRLRTLRSLHAFITVKSLARTKDGLARLVTKSFCFLQRRCSGLTGHLWLGVWVSDSNWNLLSLSSFAYSKPAAASCIPVPIWPNSILQRPFHWVFREWHRFCRSQIDFSCCSSAVPHSGWASMLCPSAATSNCCKRWCYRYSASSPVLKCYCCPV